MKYTIVVGREWKLTLDIKLKKKKLLVDFKTHFPIPSSAAHLVSISKAGKMSSQVRLDYRRQSLN